MDSSGGSSNTDPFSDPHSKKTEQSTPVKRPRQKRLQFDLVTMQQQHQQQQHQPVGNPSHYTPQYSGSCEDLSFATADSTRWFTDGGGGGGVFPPRRDTPVPEALPQCENELWEEIQSLLEVPTTSSSSDVHHPQRHPQQIHQQHIQSNGSTTGLQHLWNSKRPQRQTQSFNRLDRIPTGMIPTNYPFLNEVTTHRNNTQSFSASRSERARFMQLMNPHPPPVFDPSPRTPPMDLRPNEASSAFRKTPLQQPPRFHDRLVGDEEMYDEFANFRQRDWGSPMPTTPTQMKTPAPQLAMDQRFRQMRRPRHPTGLRQEPSLNSFVTRHNSLFDYGYTDHNQDRNSGRNPSARERLNRLDHRQSPLDEAREQEIRASMERHRARQSGRDRRSPCRGSEFGALMSALGLVPDEGSVGNLREGNGGISRMREAMVGFATSRLPPHLLFSDRDFDGDDYEFLSRLDDSVESKKGADDQIINKIHLCPFNPQCSPRKPGTSVESRCPICLENFMPRDELRVMPCHHKYHRCCLDKWLKINAVCPICNMNVKDKFHEEPPQQQQQHS
eukprot:g856.t1